MAWIESHQELARHPKVRQLARELGVSVPTTIGHLHLLWWWSLDYAEDGNVGRHCVEDIDEATMWQPKRGGARFYDAALASGFIDSDGRLHDWQTYAGRLIDQRRKDAERKRMSRASPPACPADVRRTSNGQAPDDRPPSGVTVPNRTVPNQTRDVDAVAADAAPGGVGGFVTLAGALRRLRQPESVPDEVRERLQRPPIELNGVHDADAR